MKFLCFLVSPFILAALPQDMTVVHGGARLISSDTALEIVASDRSTLNWDAFSIGDGESVRFIQPDVSASVLNRVTGGHPSLLMGRLESIGQVILFNQNGIFVGESGVVDVGSLIASTFACDEAAYLQGREMTFENLSQGKVEILGQVTTRSGDAIFLAGTVEMGGIVRSSAQVCVLAGGEAVLKTGHKNMYVRASRGAPDALAIEGGRIVVKGSIETDGADVRLVASDIEFPSGLIDTSSGGNGGNIFIGGGFQGGDPAIPNADTVMVGVGASLIASSTGEGSGGTVVLWSERNTHFEGRIDATGGARGGDGGMAEISSHGGLLFKGPVCLMAPLGQRGTLLLDPGDVTIEMMASSPAFSNPYNPAVGPGILDIADLTATLGAGTSVTVLTSAGAFGSGDITFDPAHVGLLLLWAADASLSLIADRDLKIEGAAIIAGAGYTGAFPQILLQANAGGAGGNVTFGFAGQSYEVGVGTATAGIQIQGVDITIGDAASMTGPNSVQFSTPRLDVIATGDINVIAAGAGFSGSVLINSGTTNIQADNVTFTGGGASTYTVGWFGSDLDADITSTLTLMGGSGNTTHATFSMSGTMDISATTIHVEGGGDDNANALLESTGDQTLNASQNILVQGGSGNTTHGRIHCTGPSVQHLITPQIDMFGGSDVNANAEIHSSGSQIFDLTSGVSTLSMTGGSDNGTDAWIRATGGDQTILAETIEMQGGASVFGNCVARIEATSGDQTITLTGELHMTSGATPTQNGAGCVIEDSVGDQTITATQIVISSGLDPTTTNEHCIIRANGSLQTITTDMISMFHFDGLGHGQIIAANDQIVQAGAIVMTGGGEILANGTGTQQITTAGNLTGDAAAGINGAISLRNDMGPQILSIGGTLFLQANATTSVVVTGSDDSVATVQGDFFLRGSTTGSSNATWDYGNDSSLTVLENAALVTSLMTFTNNGTIDITSDLEIGDASTLSTTTLSMGAMSSFTVGGNCPIIGGSGVGATASAIFTGPSTGRIQGNVSIFGGSGDTADASILYQGPIASTSLSIGGDLSMQGGSGNFSFAALGALSGFPPTPSVGTFDLIVGNDVTLNGGSGTLSGAFVFDTFPGTLRIGRDLSITGGAGTMSESMFLLVDVTVANPSHLFTVAAGRNISIFGGNAAGGSAPGYIQACQASLNVSAGGNISLTAGDLSNTNDAMIGAFFGLQGIPGFTDTFTSNIQCFGNFSAQNGAAGSIASLDCVATGIASPFFIPLLFAMYTGSINNNATLNLRASGDVTMAASFSAFEAPFGFDTLIHDITTIADSPFAPGALWSGSTDPFLAGTPLASNSPASGSSGAGAFRVNTGPVGGGIQFDSTLGNIHVGSAPQFTTGGNCTIEIGPLAVANQLFLVSGSGEIRVDPPFNIAITAPIVTGGSVFLMAQNDISMSAAASISAGGAVDIITDNQEPAPPLFGPGGFDMDAAATITSGTTLKIYTAILTQNSILGILNGAPFAVGTPYINTATGQWCSYYPIPGFGIPYTVFYKDCIETIAYSASLVATQFLVYLHPYDEDLGWIEQFTMIDPYQIRRRRFNLIHLPKEVPFD